ncbi:ParB/RepB/Spo0J family partition protein [Paenibacillus doosanensis]|uniref:ParB/RepB/Spo0J family partition protein n=1 Tax=Paenibacillus doosanensis TaxID=1229154 RepID=UPI00217FEB67|nr:ParB/RepB/Spo0J family partition protein [Paenibacillus doosanensis]MCS7459197.1 ParB/RepB/Spo0J family partition protein [Paenibacillus doosanensis]
MIWANISKVVPNPKNPRGDISVKTAEMQQIIKSKGWETGITCYEKDSKYIILSGHRRWHAAKKLKIKELPIILVEAPKSEEEELKRLGSVQGGKEDWTDYEWAKHTYEMWISWEKCSFEELAKKMRRSSRWVAERVRIFQYYPHNEIEDGFIKGSLNITVLYRLIGWLEKLSNQKSSLVESFSLGMIRSTMLQKIENRLVSITDLKNERFIRESSDEQMKKFLLDNKMELLDCLLGIGTSTTSEGKNESSSCQQKLKNLTEYFKQLKLDDISNTQEILAHINNVRSELLKKQSELRTFL